MSPPIRLCQAGHNICSRCLPSLQFSGGNKCSRCQKTLLETRNVALETIARGLKYPCRYNGAGCRDRFSMDEISRHHAKCPHRSYDCPLRGLESCYWTGRSTDIQEHVENSHKSATVVPIAITASEVAWGISNAECYQNSHHVVFALQEVFVLHKRFDIPHRKLCLAVQHCWDTPDNQKPTFRYGLQLEKNGGKQSALLSNVVHSDTDDLDLIFLSGDCIKVDFDMLMNFVKGIRSVRITATRNPEPII